MPQHCKSTGAALTISNDSEYRIKGITIHDMNGKKIYDSGLINVSNAEQVTLELGSFNNGVYLVSIRTDSETIETKKLVILK